MANDRVATIKGTFLVPTVSKNRRLYTKENIGKAVGRMQERIKDNGDLPVTMFPSHNQADTDNALMTIGRVTKVAQEADGSATFEADIANTSAGRDMAALLTPENPYIKGVSIRGAWMAKPETVEADDGKQAVTAPDLDVFGIDWTGRPGVEGAQITDAKLAESTGLDLESAVFESVDAEGFFDEAETPVESGDTEVADALAEVATQLIDVANRIAEGGDAPGNGKKPYGNVTYADPGYQADKKKRYPIDTADHVRAAWAYINKSKNAGAYTSAQLSRIKSKIKSAAKKFGIDVTEEFDQLVADIQDTLEAYASMSVSNGAGSISTSGYTDDAGKLAPMARRIAMAAIIGLNALDPDEDGDIDLVMPDGSSDSSSSSTEATEKPDDNNMEASSCSECGAMLPENALFCPTCANPVPNAESQIEAAPTIENKEAPVADETQTQQADGNTTESAAVTPEAAPAGVTLTNEQFTALLARLAPVATEAAPEEKPAEPLTMTQEELDAKIAAAAEAARVEAQTEALDAIRASGIIPRRGLAGGQTAGQFSTPVESKIPTLEELSEMTDDAYYGNTYEALAAHPRWARFMAMADERAAY